MQILTWNHISELVKNHGKLDCPNGSGISVGSFDGFHKGHRLLLKKLTDYCKKNNCKSVVVSFTRPLPSIKKSGSYEGDVSTLKQRIDFFEQQNIDYLILVEFSKEFAALSGSAFFNLIKSAADLKFIAEGMDFRCGYKGSFDSECIKEWANENNIETDFLQPVIYKNSMKKEERISSSSIRNNIKTGNFVVAAAMLERPYELDLSDVDQAYKQIPKEKILQVLPENGEYKVKVFYEAKTDYCKQILLKITDNEILLSENEKLIEKIIF